MDMRVHRLTGRNVIMEFAFSLVQVNRFHADRKNVSCFSYEQGGTIFKLKWLKST